MRDWRRDFIRPMLANKLAGLHAQAFEDFFHQLMEVVDPGFFPVGTSQGDLGADGMLISGRRLYACYGPQVLRARDARVKIREDFIKAVANRGSHFDTFVFAHNEQRGLSPEVTVELGALQEEYPHLGFENCGISRMVQMLRKLDQDDVEDLVGPFPVETAVSGVELVELAPLLEHLATRRLRNAEPDSIPVPPRRKLEYNGFGEDTLYHLIRALTYVPLVRDYYKGLINPFERDEVAAAFRREYLDLEKDYDDPDMVVEQLKQYVLGNRAALPKEQNRANVILMYFFGECEIFKVPPKYWRPFDGISEGGAE